VPVKEPCTALPAHPPSQRQRGHDSLVIAKLPPQPFVGAASASGLPAASATRTRRTMRRPRTSGGGTRPSPGCSSHRDSFFASASDVASLAPRARRPRAPRPAPRHRSASTRACRASAGPRRPSCSLLERAGGLLVVAFDGLPGRVRDALRHQLGRRAEQRVAVLDVRVEERERQARLHGLHPQADLAQLDRHRVEVHAVDAAPTTCRSAWRYSAAEGVPLACSRATCAASRRAAASRKCPEPQAGSTMDSVQQRLDRLARVRGDGVGDHRLERAVEQHLHEAVGRVVAAGGLAGVALGLAAVANANCASPSFVICGTSSSRLS
jgi:hypothetical protein